MNVPSVPRLPALARRSPSYVVRQLFDIQSGVCGGVARKKMKLAVAKLTVKDMVVIAAYTASLRP